MMRDEGTNGVGIDFGKDWDHLGPWGETWCHMFVTALVAILDLAGLLYLKLLIITVNNRHVQGKSQWRTQKTCRFFRCFPVKHGTRKALGFPL